MDIAKQLWKVGGADRVLAYVGTDYFRADFD